MENNNKEKIKLAYESTGLRPYEFEKKLVEQSRDSIFDYDENGHITGLNYFNFGVAASNLLDTLTRQQAGE